jgi:hypothetical protein
MIIVGGTVCGALLALAIYLNWPSRAAPIDPKLVHEFETDAVQNPRPPEPIPTVNQSVPPPRTDKGDPRGK